MRTLLHPVFIVCNILFLLNQWLEQQQLYYKFLYQYLDDTLCLPIVLTIILTVERLYFRDPGFVFAPGYTLAAVLLFSVCFELVLPVLSSTYAADVWDVLFYSVGAIVFHFTINKPLALRKPL